MEIPSFIENILKRKKITDILESRGFSPEREHGGKIFYKCPIHLDKDPSFIVFNNEEYQSYYCFGCHSGTTVINLVSDLDDITIGKAIFQLSNILIKS